MWRSIAKGTKISRAWISASGDGRRKSSSYTVFESEDKILESWKYLRRYKGRVVSLGRIIPLVLFPAQRGEVHRLVLKTRTKQRNVMFDVSPETAEMAAHCLDYKLIWRSILRRATSCARPCTRWLAESKSTTTAAATGSRLLWGMSVAEDAYSIDANLAEGMLANKTPPSTTSSDLRIGRKIISELNCSRVSIVRETFRFQSSVAIIYKRKKIVRKKLSPFDMF